MGDYGDRGGARWADEAGLERARRADEAGWSARGGRRGMGTGPGSRRGECVWRRGTDNGAGSGDVRGRGRARPRHTSGAVHWCGPPGHWGTRLAPPSARTRPGAAHRKTWGSHGSRCWRAASAPPERHTGPVRDGGHCDRAPCPNRSGSRAPGAMSCPRPSVSHGSSDKGRTNGVGGATRRR